MFEGIAYAQAAPAGGSLLDQILTGPGGSIFPIVMIFVVMYFVMIRPQTKKASDHKKMLDALKKNDEVVTTGGLIGKIADLNDKVVTLEIAPNVKVRIERTQIAASSNQAKTTK